MADPGSIQQLKEEGLTVRFSMTDIKLQVVIDTTCPISIVTPATWPTDEIIWLQLLTPPRRRSRRSQPLQLVV
jgi:hypothetical protein